MSILTTAIATFILLLLIGIMGGMFFNRASRGWLGRQVADVTGMGDVTYALIGIAGSFMGYHIGVILELLPTILLYVAATVGAFLTLFLWRRV
jgi:uncharacterized membrane protein YeaQ/YmgE (transglycosylase-associated protein family)